jgi:hypothetical protein
MTPGRLDQAMNPCCGCGQQDQTSDPEAGI